MLTSVLRNVKPIFAIFYCNELQCVLRTHCNSLHAAHDSTGHANYWPGNKIAVHSTQRVSLRNNRPYDADLARLLCRYSQGATGSESAQRPRLSAWACRSSSNSTESFAYRR